MIFNKTKNRVLAKEYSIYKGVFQAKGLMFSNKKAAVFPFSNPRKVSIHTILVFYPIDIILLDDKSRVIEKKENIAPYSFYKSEKEASLMIELPSPSGKTVSLRDTISFK